MALIRNVNVNGVPCIESTGVVVTTDAVTFSFDPHSYGRGNRFAGLIAIKIRPQDTFTAPTTAVPIVFTTTGISGSNVTLTGFNGASIESSAWQGTGIYLTFYDSDTGLLHLIS